MKLVKVLAILISRNFFLRWLDQTTLLLKWDPPRDEGGRSDTQYRVECPLCSAAAVMTPKSPTSQTSVTVNNLQPGATYKIRVLAINGVSGLSVENDNYAEISAYSNSESRASIGKCLCKQSWPANRTRNS